MVPKKKSILIRSSNIKYAESANNNANDVAIESFKLQKKSDFQNIHFPKMTKAKNDGRTPIRKCVDDGRPLFIESYIIEHTPKFSKYLIKSKMAKHKPDDVINLVKELN